MRLKDASEAQHEMRYDEEEKFNEACARQKLSCALTPIPAWLPIVSMFEGKGQWVSKEKS